MKRLTIFIALILTAPFAGAQAITPPAQPWAYGTKVPVANGGTNADLSGTGGTSQVLKQTSVGGNVSVARLACADLSDSASGCSGAAGGGGLLTYSAQSASLSGTRYLPIGGGGPSSTTEADVDSDIRVTATISNFAASISVAFGAGNSAAYTWRDNGADTAITCTISGASATDCADTTHSIGTVAGHLYSIKVVYTGTIVVTPNFQITTQFGSTNSNGVVGSGTNGQVAYYNGTGTTTGGFTLAGDCTLSQPNITCTKTGGTTFGGFATRTYSAADDATDTSLTIASKSEVNYKIHVLATNLTINNPTGPIDGDRILLRIKDNGGGPYTLTWGTTFLSMQDALPATTVSGKWMDMMFIYEAQDNKWHFDAYNVQP